MENNISSRIISMILAIVIAVGCMPISVIAEGVRSLSGASPSGSSISSPSESVSIGSGSTAEKTLVYGNSSENWNGIDSLPFARGNGSLDNPYIITTAKELKYLSDEVLAGDSFAGKHIRLGTNITLNNKSFTPIGADAEHPFMGAFDGDGHEIANFILALPEDMSDVSVSYLGLFGYIKGAEVKRLGISDYTVDTTYTYGAVIGSLVAYMEESSVTDVYSHGEINAARDELISFNRSDALTYTPDELPEVLDIDNPHGQGIIIDFSTASSSRMDKSLTLRGDISSVKLMGKPEGSFIYMFNLVIETESFFNMFIEIENLGIQSCLGSAIKCESEKNIYIRSSGSNTNTIDASDPVSDLSRGNDGIDAPNSNIYFLGSADLNVTGSPGMKGSDGQDATVKGAVGGQGGVGTNGGEGITARSVTVDMSACLYLNGGYGGQGGTGGKGGTGSDGAKGKNEWAQTHIAGGTGGIGGAGGAGGQGGASGLPLVITGSGIGLSVYENAKVVFSTGGSGKGGTGGVGGTGGKGGNAANGWASVGYEGPSKAGVGGQGGPGGIGGRMGEYATATVDSQNNITYTFESERSSSFSAAIYGDGLLTILQSVYGVGGTGGQGGDGGQGGKGGNKVSCLWGSAAASKGGQGGSNGIGGQGGDGTVPGEGGANGSVGAGGFAADSGSAGPGAAGTLITASSVGGNKIAVALPKLTASSLDAATAPELLIQNITFDNITVGGLIGESDQTSSIVRASSSIAKMNVTASTSDELSIYAYKGYLIGKNGGTAEAAIAMYDSGAGLYSKYNYGVVGFGSISDARITVLNGRADASGVVYTNGIEDNRVVASRSAVSLAEGYASDITLGEYVVFGGKNVAVLDGIGSLAFASSDITSLSIGDNITAVGEGILAGCRSIKTIHIGRSLTEIPELGGGKALFAIDKAHSSLEKYTVSEGNRRFSAESGLLLEAVWLSAIETAIPVAVVDAPVKNSVMASYVPEAGLAHIVKIYDYAFAYNEYIESVRLDYVREIGDGAFENSARLKSVVLSETAEGTDKVTVNGTEYDIPPVSYRQTVGINAFFGCKYLEKLDLSSPYITLIGNGAFVGCGQNASTPIRITFGKSIRAVGCNYAQLYEGAELTEEQISVANQSSVFYSSSANINAKIESIDVHPENATYASADGVLYRKKADGSKTLIIYPNYKRDREFTAGEPASLSVNTVGKYAFSGAQYLEEVTVGEGITFIDDYAFSGSMLVRINIGRDVERISSGNDGQSMPHLVFSSCMMLESVSVDPDNANFSDIDGVLYGKQGGAETLLIKYPAMKPETEFDAPASLKEVSDEAFRANARLVRVTFHSEIEEFGARAFHECASLSLIYFKVGAPPKNLSTRSSIARSNAFVTYNPNSTCVCYGEEKALWEAALKTDSGDVVYTFTDNNTGALLYRFGEFMGYPTSLRENNYYVFVITDKGGNPVNNATLTLGDYESVYTQDGMTSHLNPDFDKMYKLSIIDHTGRHFPYENNEFYLDSETRITYIALSSVPTVSGVNVSYTNKDADALGLKNDLWFSEMSNTIYIGNSGRQVYDFNSEKVVINKWLVDKSFTVRMMFGCDSDKILEEYYVIQKGAKIVSFDGSAAEAGSDAVPGKLVSYANIEIPTESLVLDEDIYVVALFADGSGEVETVSSKLNLQVIYMELPKIDLPILTEGFKIDVAEDIPIIGGMTIDIAESADKRKENPFNVSVMFGSDFYRIIISDGKYQKHETEFGNHQDTTYDSVKEFEEAWETYRNENEGKKQGDKNKTPIEDEYSRKLTLSYSGYIETKYKGLKSDGTPDLAYTACITGTISYTIGGGRTVQVWVLPIRFEYEVGISGSVSFSLVFDKEANSLLNANSQLEISGGINGFAGIGCSSVSVGIYGSVTTVLVIDIFRTETEGGDFGLNSWSLIGDMGLLIQYNGLFVEWKVNISFFPPPEGSDAETSLVWEIYKDGKWYYEVTENSDPVSINSALVDQNNYAVAMSLEERAELVGYSDSAFSGTNARLIRAEDKIYIIYTDDVNGYDGRYDSYNYQKILCQVYDIASGEYSDPVILDDSGYADCAFDAIYENGRVYVLYSSLGRRLTAEDTENVEGYVSSLDMKIACIDCESGAATVEKNFASDAYYDYSPMLGYIGGALSAVWVKNSANSMFGVGAASNSVMLSSLASGGWSDASVLKSGIDTVTDIALGGGMIAYITDENNDVSTVAGEGGESSFGYSDRVIRVIDESGAELAVRAASDHLGISYMDGAFAYYRASGIIYKLDMSAAESDAPVISEPVSGLTENYFALEDEDGALKAIIFVSNNSASEDSSDLYGIFKNGDVWGAPIKLTSSAKGSYISSYTALDLGDSAFYAILSATDKTVDEGGADEDGFTPVSYNYSFDKFTREYPTGYTAAFGSVDPSALSENSTASVSIVIRNDGVSALYAADIEALVSPMGGAAVSASVRSEFYDAGGRSLGESLPSGRSAYIIIGFDPGAASDKLCGFKLGENEFDARIWNSDIAIYAKQVTIGGEYNLAVRIANEGFIQSGATSLKVIGKLPTDGAGGGFEIAELAIEPISAGESKYLTVPVYCDASGALIEEDEYAVTLYAAPAGYSYSESNAAWERVDGVLYAEETNISNNDRTVTVSKTPENDGIELDSLLVWVSASRDFINRTEPRDVLLTFDSAYTVKRILANGSEIPESFYMVSSNTVQLDSQDFISAFENGELDLTLEFNEMSNGVVKSARLTISMTESFVIKWDVSGSITESDFDFGATPAFDGSPVKDRDAQYTYKFIGWDEGADDLDGSADHPVGAPLPIATENITYTAVFEAVLNYYDITWRLDGGALEAEQYGYGSTPVYKKTPEKPSTVQYYYVFAGWAAEDGTEYPPNSLPAVTGGAVYTAVFDEMLRSYTVTWIVEGAESKTTAEYGSIPTPDGVTLFKEPTLEYQYRFVGWDRELAAVTGDTSYTAVFAEEPREYSVTWNAGGIFRVDHIKYGDVPTYIGVPSKKATAQYAYIFIGWDLGDDDGDGAADHPIGTALPAVSENVRYTAVFTEELREYEVKWNTGTGGFESEMYFYGETPVFKGKVPSYMYNGYFRKFSGWDIDIKPVVGTVTYTAQFESFDLSENTAKLEIDGEYRMHVGYEYTYDIIITKIGNDDGLVSFMTDTFVYDPLLLEYTGMEIKSAPEGWHLEAASSDGSIAFAVIGDKAIYDPDELAVSITFKAVSAGTGRLYAENILSQDSTDGYAPITLGDKSYKVVSYDYGDFNEDGRVDSKDVLYFNEKCTNPYTLNQNGDFNGDGRTDKLDAEYLLLHTFYPEDYPLYTKGGSK